MSINWAIIAATLVLGASIAVYRISFESTVEASTHKFATCRHILGIIGKVLKWIFIVLKWTLIVCLMIGYWPIYLILRAEANKTPEQRQEDEEWEQMMF